MGTVIRKDENLQSVIIEDAPQTVTIEIDTLDDAAAEEIATQLFNELSEAQILALLSQGGAKLACGSDDTLQGDVTLPQDFMDCVAAQLNKLLKASQSAPRYAALEITKCFALRRSFMIFGKLDDEDALWDSLEGNGVNIWRCHVKLGCYESDEYKGYGWFFLTTPRWAYREEVDRALGTYYNKMCWKYPEYKDYCLTEMSDILWKAEVFDDEENDSCASGCNNDNNDAGSAGFSGE